MTIRLFFEAIFKYLLGIIFVGSSLFLSAGTFCYFNAILLMCILFVPMFIAGIVMMFKNPDLLKKRLYARETRKDQKITVMLCGIMFIIGFAVAGLGIRFKWHILPVWVSVVAAVAFLASYILYAQVLRENAYLSRTIQVVDGQKVMDTGLYSVVRHPMYSATLLMFLSMPLVLGSVYSFLIFLFYPLIIVKRIKGEEAFLEKNLVGYGEYIRKTKYRLIPFIW